MPMDDGRATGTQNAPDERRTFSVTPVSGTVHVVHGANPRPGPADDRAWVPSLADLDLTGTVRVLRWSIAALLVAAGAAAFVGDLAWDVLVVAATIHVARHLDTILSFSFADGIVVRSRGLGWPRGVQEDNDVRWSWTARAKHAA